MENEDFYKEVSEQETEVGQQEEVIPGVAVVAVAPLNVQVTDNPESLSPSPPSPSPEVPSPPPSPLGDLPSFKGFYTLDDLTELVQWVVYSTAARSQPELRFGEPEVSANLRTFPRVMLGRQWKLKLSRHSGEVLFDQLMAYLAGYNQPTSFNSQQWLRLLHAWTATERREQLELLAEAGGFLVLRAPGPSFRSSVVLGRRHFVLWGAHPCVKILELHKN